MIGVGAVPVGVVGVHDLILPEILVQPDEVRPRAAARAGIVGVLPGLAEGFRDAAQGTYQPAAHEEIALERREGFAGS